MYFGAYENGVQYYTNTYKFISAYNISSGEQRTVVVPNIMYLYIIHIFIIYYFGPHDRVRARSREFVFKLFGYFRRPLMITSVAAFVRSRSARVNIYFFSQSSPSSCRTYSYIIMIVSRSASRRG